MIICISGLTGSGKTTIGEMLSKELRIRHVSRSYKEIAGGGKSLIAFNRSVKPSFDRKFDREIIKEARSGDSVVSTSLGPWIIKNSSLNVWLNASLDARARRKAKAHNNTFKEEIKYIKAKDGTWISHVKKNYGIDITTDHDVFDIEINTERLSKDKIVSLIAMLSLEKSGKKFR